MGSCFMVIWTMFKTHLLEVGLPQNRETMTLTTVDIVYFNMREDLHEHGFIGIAFGRGPGHI